ncbi:hypothetical protein AB0I61_00150 [Polymorphospora rubra]|uniref:hypothetical protein n=1 Tax=Polymorphospora rubra TaxID=338584 RepID=UPI0033DDCA14
MTDAADVASDAEPTYRWLAQPPNLPRYGYAEITEALVPILIWPAVPVLKRVEHGLSVVERFVLEAALTLQGVRAEDITEITGIPTDIAFRVADRLRALGALDRVDGTFEPIEPVTREVLTSQRLPEYHQANLQFMYLADTDELIAYDSGPGTPDPPLVHLVPVACQAPVPAGLVGRSRATLLNERIAAGRVAGLPDWVHAAVDDDARCRRPPRRTGVAAAISRAPGVARPWCWSCTTATIPSAGGGRARSTGPTGYGSACAPAPTPLTGRCAR